MADVLSLNGPVPDFSLEADDGSMVSLQGLRAQGPVLIFFYPGDFTPVCTAEVCAFRDDYHHFRSRGIGIVGISPDTVDKHRRFAEACKIPFRLLSDPDHGIARRFGAKGLLGMRRAYFLVSPEGNLLWQHAEVLPIFKLSNSRIIETLDTLLRTLPATPAGSRAAAFADQPRA